MTSRPHIGRFSLLTIATAVFALAIAPACAWAVTPAETAHTPGACDAPAPDDTTCPRAAEMHPDATGSPTLASFDAQVLIETVTPAIESIDTMLAEALLEPAVTACQRTRPLRI
jgi:hypothetical protein